jgi:valyl-tRNA synthetase
MNDLPENPSELSQHFDCQQVEPRLYQGWLQLEAFKADPQSKKKSYTLVLPPPNVTGVLHIGHALTCTLEDILVRRKRMQGFNTLWIPGTDHAGIATQMVVEKMLLKDEKTSRHDLGREKFLERVWKWKAESQGTILSQLKMIGCSLDWSRLSFTLDDGVSLAVRECFTRLYKEGLIYRQEAITQWCPRCLTALSDLEVKFKETKGKIWHIRYLLDNDPSKSLIVATTRPETLLADTAVAIHPEDERYQSFHGKRVRVPLCDRTVPVITDAYVDKEFGTGALKITPGHDPNDYLIGKQHKLPIIILFDERAKVLSGFSTYAGLSREKAREKVLEDLEAQGLLEKAVDYTHSVGHCDRCSTVVEPRVSLQWFVDAKVLAEDAIRAVETKEIKILPVEWEKTYFEWMRNIRPWCISRQLWWGHRIPVWYCQSCTHIHVAVTTPHTCEKCGVSELRQEEDVLDTWFSSGLWPFSTLGWPAETEDFKAFYPNDILETGFDILFFWVARMIMLGKRMTGKFPFHTVYLHPMVRDEYGQKMSKTKGNVKDPLEIIERVGADALRFTLASLAVHGRDVSLSDSRIEGYRNFVNKIWNASRFVLGHFSHVKESKIDKENLINRWILSKLDTVVAGVNTAIDQYRFFDAANLLYQFIWSEYCDWFLELIKVPEELEARKNRKDSTALEVLEQAIRLLHPFMPFVTEEIWQKLPVKGNQITVCLADYPTENAANRDAKAELRMGQVIAVIEGIRTKRGENNVSPAKHIPAAIVAEAKITGELKGFEEVIRKIARISELSWGKPASNEAQISVPITFLDQAWEVFIPQSELVNIAEEKERASKELKSTEEELQRAIDKLQNPTFTGKAPESVVIGVKERKEVLEKKVDSLKAYLKNLK